MQAYHITEILVLEALIKQPQINLENIEDASKRHRLFLNWKKENKALCKVIEYKDQIIAFYHLLLDEKLIQSFYHNDCLLNKKYSYLAQISISKQFQKQGLGQKMMDDIYKESQVHQKQEVILEVNSTSKAYQFYQTQNFETLEAQVFMSKKL